MPAELEESMEFNTEAKVGGIAQPHRRAARCRSSTQLQTGITSPGRCNGGDSTEGNAGSESRGREFAGALISSIVEEGQEHSTDGGSAQPLR